MMLLAVNPMITYPTNDLVRSSAVVLETTLMAVTMFVPSSADPRFRQGRDDLRYAGWFIHHQ